MSVRDLMVSVQFDADVSMLSDINDVIDDMVMDLVDVGDVGDKSFGEMGIAASGASDDIADMGREGSNAVDQLGDSARGTSDDIDGIKRTSGKTRDSVIKDLQAMSDSMHNTGSNLTKWITLPIAGAVTAAAGLTSVLGWKRLVGLDSAQAQLKGLGYTTEEVGRISEQVTTAIDGGMTTMAEGTAVAAGALAAGVEEGKELERYIKLVGDAAVGANRPVDDMAMIFNRVQGSGKLMTQELNMIEQGMPGFAKAMSDSLGVAPEEFRKMVTDGKVSSKQFLDVMDDFAGDMAKAYSESWEGMTQNTLAYIGIIGEALLEGLFEDGKKTLAGFIELLKSDAVMDWATETGQKIREISTDIIDGIRKMKAWFDDLSPGIKSIITKVVVFGGIFMTALGPALLILSKIISVALPIISLFSQIAGVVQGAGGAFALLSNPIGWVVAAVGLLIGAFILAYNKVEWFRDMVLTAWDWIKESTAIVFGFILEKILMVWDFIVEATSEFWQGLMEIWSEHGEFIVELVTQIFDQVGQDIQIAMMFMQEIISFYWSIISAVFEVAWALIQTIVQIGIDVVLGIINHVMSVMQGDWEGAWEAIMDIGISIWEGIEGFFSSVDLVQIGEDIIQGLIDGIDSMKEAVWGRVEAIAEGIKSKFSWVLEIFSPSRVFEEYGKNTMEGFDGGVENESVKTMNLMKDTGRGVSDAFQVTPASSGRVASRTEKNYSFNINVSGGSDARATAREIKEVIKSYMHEIEVREV